MKLNKKIILIIVFIILGIVIGYWFIKNYYKEKPVSVSHISRQYDTSNPEIAVNNSDYIFIAKINSILRTEYRNHVEVEVGLGQTIIEKDPYTIYDITVIENLKGNLITDTSIEFVQYGGINEDGTSYSLLENSSLLNIGEYYLLMVGTLPATHEIEVSDNNRMISLGNDISNLNNNLIDDYKNIINNNRANTTELIDVNMSKYDINYNNDTEKESKD